MTPRTPLMLAAFVMLGACQTLDWQEEMQPRAEKRLTVTEVAYAQTVQAPDTGILARDEAERLRSFVIRTGAQGAGAVTVVTRSREPARRTAVLDALSALNVRGDRVAFGFDDRALAKDEVRVEVVRAAVTLPECPDLTTPSGSTYDNRPNSNWGCATAINLGLMVADPNDLVAGRSSGPADGEALSLSVYRYRTGQTKALNIDDGNTGETYGAAGQSNAPVLPGGGQ